MTDALSANGHLGTRREREFLRYLIFENRFVLTENGQLEIAHLRITMNLIDKAEQHASPATIFGNGLHKERNYIIRLASAPLDCTTLNNLSALIDKAQAD